MDQGWVDAWVRKGEELASRAEPVEGLSGEAQRLVDEARTDASRSPEGPKLLEAVSGRLRVSSAAPAASGEETRTKLLAELALGFSRAAGELAGSPT